MRGKIRWFRDFSVLILDEGRRAVTRKGKLRPFTFLERDDRKLKMKQLEAAAFKQIVRLQASGKNMAINTRVSR